MAASRLLSPKILLFLQEAEEAAAAEVLKLQQELEMEEAGLEPHPEVDEDNLDDDEHDNPEMMPTDQQSYQLYVQASKQALDCDDDANLSRADHDDADIISYGAEDNLKIAAEANADNAEAELIFSEEEQSSASDPLRRRRVRNKFFYVHELNHQNCNELIVAHRNNTRLSDVTGFLITIIDVAVAMIAQSTLLLFSEKWPMPN